jgi:Tfp pilus assembly protein PilV
VHQENFVKRRLHGTLGVATLKVKTVRCRHTGLKVKTVGSPPTLAQRVLNETLWNPAFFCCWKIEAAQGWNGRVSVAAVIVAKCRRLGGSLAAGLQPAKKDSRFSTSCSASLLNATY